MDQYVIVGREDELDMLAQVLEEAKVGRGSTMLVSGEPGIGKSRLVNEFLKTADPEMVIRGAAQADLSQPFQLFSKALESVIDKPLFERHEFNSFSKIFAIDRAGLLLAQANSKKADEMDADIFAGMLSAVQSFVRDSFDNQSDSGKGLGRLEYGNMKILIEHGEHMFLTVVFEGEEHSDMLATVRGTMQQINEELGHIFENWGGRVEELGPLEMEIERLSRSKFFVRRNLEGVSLMNERIRIADEVLDCLKGLTTGHPLVLFLEDLHWADESSMFVFEYLARNIESENIQIIGTFRPNESQILDDIIGKLTIEPCFTILPLLSLSQNMVSDLVGSMYSDHCFPDTFVQALADQCEGNPLFVQEMLVQMQMDGNIILHDGKHVLQSEDYTIPGSIESLVQRRLDILEPDAMTVVECASCIGREFERAAATSTSMVSDELRAINDLQNSGILWVQDDNGEFNHVIYQMVTYDGIGERWKQVYHKSIGEYYENVYRDEPVKVIYELASHFAKSGENKKAFDYCVRAAEKAELSYAPEQAIEYYQDALSALGKYMTAGHRSKKADLLERLADLKAFTADFNSAIDLYEKALELFADNKDRARLFRKKGSSHERLGEYEKAVKSAHSGMAEISADHVEYGRLTLLEGLINRLTGNHDMALELYSQAMDVFDRLDASPRDIGIVLRAIGNAYRKTGSFDKAQENYRGSLEQFQKIDDENEMAMLFNNMGNVMCDTGDFDESLATYNKAIEIWERIRNKKGVAQVSNNLGVLAMEKGEIDLAIEHYTRSVDYLKQIGLKAPYATILNNIGNTYAAKGQYDKTREYFLKSLEIRESIDNKDGIAQSLNNLGLLHTDLGELDSALDYFKRSLEIAKEIKDKTAIPLCHLNIAEVHRYKGEYEEALALFLKSKNTYLEINDPRTLVNSYCGLADTYIEMGRDTEALGSAELALETALKIESKTQEEMARISLATVYRRTGLTDKAEKQLALAEQLSGSTGQMHRQAQVAYERGMLEKEKGNFEKAKEHINKALEMFESSGMKLWAGICRDAL